MEERCVYHKMWKIVIVRQREDIFFNVKFTVLLSKKTVWYNICNLV